MVVVTTLESFCVTIKVRTKHILAETSQGRIEGGGDTEIGLNNEWLKERVGEGAAMDDAFHKRRQPWITRSQSFSASMPPPTFMEQGCDLDENHKECVGEVAAIQVGWLDWFPNSRETSHCLLVCTEPQVLSQFPRQEPDGLQKDDPSIKLAEKLCRLICSQLK